MRQSALRIVLAASLLGLGALAEEAPKPPPPEWKFAAHGFLGGSLYAADGFMGPSPGQQTLFAVGQPRDDKIDFGGDIRQNRINLSVSGPSVLGGTPKGVVEMDFFGGNSSGGFGDVSVWPRMRVTYAELAWENTTLRVGQDYQLTAGISTLSGPATAGAMSFPTSVGHIAFPISFEAGAVGWRYPGIYLFQRMPMGDNKLELAFSVQRSAWSNPANPASQALTIGTAGTPVPGGTTVTLAPTYFTATTDLGSASGIPALEARVTYALGSMLGITVFGHYGQIDPSGWGLEQQPGTCPATSAAQLKPTACDTMTVYVVGGDFRLNVAPLIIQGGGYTGQNTSAMLGEVLQFNNLGVGDTSDWGAWAQVGFMFTKQLGLYVFAGTDHPDTAALTLGAQQYLKNTTTQAMLRYYDQGWAYGLEWTHWHTNTRTNPGAITINGAAASAVIPQAITAQDVNQYMFSTYYFF